MKPTVRIALADDHKLIRAGISMILNEQDEFEVVIQASNGQELLDGIHSAQPDVILLDLEMPVLSGPDTLAEIRKNNLSIPVLILTMHNNDAFILQMMEMGANGYLIKNTDPEEVVDAIRKVMESKFYFSDNVSKAMLNNLASPNRKTSSPLPGHHLTEREIDVLRLICKENTTTEIGDALFLSPKTIEGYRKILMDKTGAKNMAGLVLFAVRHGLYEETF